MSARERLAAQDAQLERLGAGVDRIRNRERRCSETRSSSASSTSWKVMWIRRRAASAKNQTRGRRRRERPDLLQ